MELTRRGQATATLHHLVSRRLHGTITSLARIRTLASKVDGADRVLISFKDAKVRFTGFMAENGRLTRNHG
jgi:cleavage and polyadenylation specificity factor subunit 1